MLLCDDISIWYDIDYYNVEEVNYICKYVYIYVI